MKRSEINKALRELEAMCQKYCCYLPPFCHFTPEEWKEKGHEYDEVRDCCLGWDITDYGMGDFDKMGFSLITIRAPVFPQVHHRVLGAEPVYGAVLQSGNGAGCVGPVQHLRGGYPLPAAGSAHADAHHHRGRLLLLYGCAL